MARVSHKTDYLILIFLGLLTVAVVLGLLVWGKGPPPDESWVRSTHSVNVNGMIVGYNVLERLGLSVRRLNGPLMPETLSDADVVVILDPVLGIDGGELGSLVDWVGQGGVLLCDEQTDQQIRSAYQAQTQPGKKMNPVGHTFSHSSSQKTKVTSVPKDRADLPLARDIQKVYFETTNVLALEDQEIRADASRRPADWLFADQTGLRVVGRRIRLGHIIAISDSSFWSNGRIGTADNAILATNLMTWAANRARGNRIGFDEYHFSGTGGETGGDVLAGLLISSSPGWAVLCLTAAGVLYLVYRGRRFGTRREPERVRRRSKLEYVYSIGSTFRNARAHRLTFQLIYLAFRHKAAGRAGLPDSAPASEIEAELARQGVGSESANRRIFAECEAALSQSKLAARRTAALLDELAKLELEATHGNSASE